MKYRAKSYSEDNSTIKYIFDVPKKIALGGKPKGLSSIESVFMHIPGREDDKPEYVLCLSSQMGCIYSCLLCRNMMTSFDGFLSSKEINKQISLTLAQDENLKKVVSKGSVEYAFMAIGEPLYGGNVIKAIKDHEQLVEDTRFSLSTIGAKGTINKLTKSDMPYPVRLELSLHFSNDKLRNDWLFPKEMYLDHKVERDICTMLDEAEEYSQRHPGKVTLNYALIDGINNMDSNLSELADLVRGREDIFYVKVMKPNITSSFVFSWNEDKKKKTYSPEEFHKLLLERGIPSTLFESKGTDVWAGCGMMSNRFERKKGVIKPYHIPQADPAKLGF